MKQKTTKKTVNYSISKNVLEEFETLAIEHAINRSQLIENFLKSWIDEKKK